MTAAMSATESALERNHQTGFSDSTSSLSAEKYRLDELDENPILLYRYRGDLQTSSQKELCAELDKSASGSKRPLICNFVSHTNCPADESLRVTKKPIPRYTSYVDVKRRDLYLPWEQEEYAKFPNFDSNLASVKVPSSAYWSRLILGNYSDLYIVSPESSPTSSQADEDSRRPSPTSTWGQDSQEGVVEGASQDSSQRS